MNGQQQPEIKRGPLTEEEKIERRQVIAEMVALREKAIAGGMRLLDRDEVNALVRERRGGNPRDEATN